MRASLFRVIQTNFQTFFYIYFWFITDHITSVSCYPLFVHGSIKRKGFCQGGAVRSQRAATVIKNLFTEQIAKQPFF